MLRTRSAKSYDSHRAPSAPASHGQGSWSTIFVKSGVDYTANLRPDDSIPGVTPMDVSTLGVHAMESRQPFECYCFGCIRWGHRRSDCRGSGSSLQPWLPKGKGNKGSKGKEGGKGKKGKGKGMQTLSEGAQLEWVARLRGQTNCTLC